MCAEPRDGRLYVFMPPLATLEDYLELVAAVEATAARCSCRSCSKATSRRATRASQMLHVTPDPGVIEVNIHPAHDWSELVAHTELLYEAAHQTRLSTEKFMLDGRHTGTGGGNHFVLGGATPADWPFLRRPDLLAQPARLLAQPSRRSSYLFSGLFIGPTSQAPRIDEARNDSVYELEIALRRARSASAEVEPATAPPWLVDRAVPQPADRRHRQHAPRRVLHRQAVLARRPDRPPGPARAARLRDAAARAHEPRAAAAAARAGRALLARAVPAGAPRALGHRAARPLHAAALRLAGFRRRRSHELTTPAIRSSSHWFAPHFEFRFPRSATSRARGVEVELRRRSSPGT